MPLVASEYQAPWWGRNGHAQTLATMGRRLWRPWQLASREVHLPDGDFVDVDVYQATLDRKSSRAVILSHGLEGSSRATQIRALARRFCEAGWDAWAWSFRTCSGRPNRRPVLYHSACTDDLHAVIEASLNEGYEALGLIGHSLGGNLTLRYLGDRGESVSPAVCGAAVFSAPVDLDAAVVHMDQPHMTPYRFHFLRSLRARARWRRHALPAELPFDRLHRFTTFRDFDGAFTAPLHGFEGASHYYAAAGSWTVLGQIAVPALLCSSLDDPFLPEPCYPTELARDHPFLFLETPRHGGHCGFLPINLWGPHWTEVRALQFLQQVVKEAECAQEQECGFTGREHDR